MATPDPGGVFKGIEPGDEVTVEWPGKAKCSAEANTFGPSHYLGYGSGGVVAHVTGRLITIRHPLHGYTFSVSASQVISGTKISVVKRKGEDGSMSGLEGTEVTATEVAATIEPETQVTEAPSGEADVKEAEPGQLVSPTPAPTPLECIDQGLPLTMARVMTPKYLNKKDAAKLLEAGVDKSEIMRLYSFSTTQSCYGQLARWGLYRSQKRALATGQEVRKPEGKPEPAKLIEPPQLAVQNDALTLTQAIERRERVQQNLRCIARIRKLINSLAPDIEDVISQAEQTYTSEAKRIEAALEKVRVVI